MHKALKFLTLIAVMVFTPIQPTAFASGRYAYTLVTWSGTECIPIRSAGYNTSNIVETNTVCQLDQQIGFGRNLKPGDIYGADPSMGDAFWVDCVVTIDGVEQVRNFARRGDGREVNCLRRAA